MAKKILLADDSLTIQKVVELTFSDGDYDLVCVSNGQKALDKVRDDRPDLILADVVMPEKNGYEVCEAIKGNPATARIPVVLLSGTFEPFDRDRAERIGCDAIVSKPFDSQQLISQVEALLGKARAEMPEPEIAAGAESARRRLPGLREGSLRRGLLFRRFHRVDPRPPQSGAVRSVRGGIRPRGRGQGDPRVREGAPGVLRRPGRIGTGGVPAQRFSRPTRRG